MQVSLSSCRFILQNKRLKFFSRPIIKSSRLEVKDIFASAQLEWWLVENARTRSLKIVAFGVKSFWSWKIISAVCTHSLVQPYDFIVSLNKPYVANFFRAESMRSNLIPVLNDTKRRLGTAVKWKTNACFSFQLGTLRLKYYLCWFQQFL